jgi:hypothetical protein
MSRITSGNFALKHEKLWFTDVLASAVEIYRPFYDAHRRSDWSPTLAELKQLWARALA